MAATLDKPRFLYGALLLAALVNISVMAMRTVDADIWLYQVRIDCFAQQFWQGDLYPRWCMSANAGLGSSVFLFYFPLPFYIAALLYPLTMLGMGTDAFFTLLCFLATFLTALASFSWLRDIVTPGRALLATTLMLFIPYRLEMMYFRGAYAEIWCLVFLPLIFKYTRRMASGEANALVPLALMSGLSLLTHVPSTIAAFLFSGLYMLIMTGKNMTPKLYYAAAILWGIGLAAFYLVPGPYYEQFLAKVELVNGLYGWANGFLSLSYFLIPGLERPVVAAILTVLWLGAITLPVVKKRLQVDDAFVQKEIVAWTILGGLAMFMLLPVSLPLYLLMGPVSKIVFPWRMQVILVLAIAYMLAVRMQWMFSPGRRQTWKIDLGLALVFLWGLGHMLVASYGDTGRLLNGHIRAAQIIFSSEYRSKWTDEEHWKHPYLLSRHDNRDTIANAQVISGKGTAQVKRWRWDGIELRTDSTKDMTVRLNQTYFPVWQAKLDADSVLPLEPEEKTGQMLLTVPAGEHTVILTYSVTNGASALAISQWLSLLALAGMVAAVIKTRHIFRKARGTP